MQIKRRPTNLFAGVDHLSLDKRKFDPSQNDIECICRFFSIGKLQHYEKEKGIIISHSNFFFFVLTTQGQYALKFYPKDEAKTIAIEYAANRILLNHHFPTSIMHSGHNGQPFFISNGRLAACYSYIDGLQAWQHIKQRSILPKINATMLSLKNILATTKGHISLLKQTSLIKTINTLAQSSRAVASYDQKKPIEASLLDAYRTYKQHQRLFTRQLVHNNITLTNLLISKETVYVLDLSHIQEDYALSDLTSLIISCLFFDIPKTTIKGIVKNYFTQHKIDKEYSLVLNTLVKIGLIKEYLKNIQREKSIGLSTYPADLTRTYLSHLKTRQKTIAAVLKRINNMPKLIV